MNLDRRQFVSWSAGGALMLGLGVGPATASADQALTPWISIHPDGKVTLYSTVSEMGQGARTGQAQVLADELDVDWEQVTVELGTPAQGAPFNFLITGDITSALKAMPVRFFASVEVDTGETKLRE